MLSLFRRLFVSETWIDRLANQRDANDRAFILALGRRMAKPETIEVMHRRPSATRPVGQISAEARATARERAREEVQKHLAATPRGKERAQRFPELVAAHEIRTARVVESELLAGPDLPDFWSRLAGEARALEAEIQTERHAESFAPLSEDELTVREGQLRLVRLLLDMENARADLARRRAITAPRTTTGSTGDSTGPTAPQRTRGTVMEL